jgi:ACS family sodium-dependent inorganic phosphate cotransporter
VPVARCSTAVGIITAASYAGTALAFGISPYLISRFGWQSVFYLFGGSALLWLPFWLPLQVRSSWQQAVISSSNNSSTPVGNSSGSSSSSSSSSSMDGSQHRQQQGMDEAQPLIDGRNSFDVSTLQPQQPSCSTPNAVLGSGDGSSISSSIGSTGFRALLQRREVWAICICQYAQSYGMYGLLTWLPTFFNDYYKVELGDLGGYTLLPYLLQVGGSGGGLVVFIICHAQCCNSKATQQHWQGIQYITGQVASHGCWPAL